jgi:drug/metabolite transporter (DMT)-like permease
MLVALALGALYFIWGSTFLAMRFAIESFPPFMMAAIRFVAAGMLLYA